MELLIKLIEVLIGNPLTVTLVLSGIVCIVIAIIGELPNLKGPIEGKRALVLGLFGLLLMMIAIGMAWISAQAEFPNTSQLNTRTESISFEVIASLSWQNTNIQLQSGDSLHIEYKSGQWTGNVNLGGYAGPDNLDVVEEEPDLACFPIPGTRSEGRPVLIGKIGNNEPFNIGREFIDTISSSGSLFLRINDCDEYLFDNDGSIIVNIQVDK